MKGKSYGSRNGKSRKDCGIFNNINIGKVMCSRNVVKKYRKRLWDI